MQTLVPCGGEQGPSNYSFLWVVYFNNFITARLPVRAGVVSHYSFSFPVRNRQCLEHTCGNAPNFFSPPVHYIIPVTGR